MTTKKTLTVRNSKILEAVDNTATGLHKAGVMDAHTKSEFDTLTKPFTHMVYIGRFSPPHNGHIETIKQALQKSEYVIVVIGSHGQARNIKNPWTAEERADMIRSCFDDKTAGVYGRLVFVSVRDYLYNEQRWIVEVQKAVNHQLHRLGSDMRGKDFPHINIGLTGFAKDETSYYLKLFPQWKFSPAVKTEMHAATHVRSAFFEHGLVPNADYIHPEVAKYLTEFKKTEHYEQLVKEYEFIKSYKKRWEAAPYAPTFVTVDAVVIQSGHVLMVKRRSEPGKNLLAFPGGFLDPNERIEDAVLRELKEETKLKVPVPVLKGSIKGKEVFDHPNRSLRGRTVTHAYLIELNGEELPQVKGGSDAAKAFWMPLSEALDNSDLFFEDHYQILYHFFGEI